MGSVRVVARAFAAFAVILGLQVGLINHAGALDVEVTPLPWFDRLTALTASPAALEVQGDIEEAWALLLTSVDLAATPPVDAPSDDAGSTPITATLLRDRLVEYLENAPAASNPAFEAVFATAAWDTFTSDLVALLNEPAAIDGLQPWVDELAVGGATAESVDLVGALDDGNLPGFVHFTPRAAINVWSIVASGVATVAGAIIVVACVVATPCGIAVFVAGGLTFAAGALATTVQLVDAMTEYAADCRLSISMYRIGTSVQVPSSLVCRVRHDTLAIESWIQVDGVQHNRSVTTCTAATQCTRGFAREQDWGTHVYQAFAQGAVDQLYTKLVYSEAMTWTK